MRIARCVLLALGVLLSGVGLQAAAQEQPVRGGELVIGWHREIATLDGHRGVAGTEHVFQWLIYDQLIRFDEGGRPVPGLAESWEQRDPTTLVLHLRRGVTFHDGTPFNSEAVKYNFDRILDPEFGSAVRAELSVVQSVDILDEFTVQLNLAQPAADLLLQLSDRAGMMVSPTAAEKYGDDFSRYGVGAGPYKVTEFIPGDRLVLDRFEDFWEDGAPYLDRVTFRVFPAAETALLALRNGELHMLLEIPQRDVAWIRADPNLTYLDWPTERYLQLNINRTRPPMDDVRIRRALAYAVNRDQINQLIFGGDGRPVDHGIFPEGHWAYCEDVKNWPYDPDMARELLAEAGYPDGITLKVSVQSTELNLRMLEIIQSMLEQAGITLEAVVAAGPEGFQGFFIEGNQELRTGVWAGRPDPSATMYTSFYGGGSQNAPVPGGGHSDPELERLIDAARSTSDFAERRQLYCEAQRLIIEDVHVLAIVHTPWAMAVSNDIRGLMPQLLGKPLVRTLWLAE